MIIVMNHAASKDQVNAVLQRIEERGLKAEVSAGQDRTVIGLIGANAWDHRDSFAHMAGIAEIIRVSKPFKLASREFHPHDSLVDVDGVAVGGRGNVIMAGPCSVENAEMLLATAHHVRRLGATFLRGGAFKPRTSPYSFQGLGAEALLLLDEAKRQTGLKVVTEVVSPADVEIVAEHADVLQIGTRNMQNYSLLQEVGQGRKPVLLKRGFASTIEEWLLAAEYVLSRGNRKVILCERGIRSFETAVRFTLDLNAVPLIQELSHLPVIVDPSHGTGNWKLVTPMSLAALAAGASGLIVEVHPNPDEALSDGAQSLSLEGFTELMRLVKDLLGALGRHLVVGDEDQTLRVAP